MQINPNFNASKANPLAANQSVKEIEKIGKITETTEELRSALDAEAFAGTEFSAKEQEEQRIRREKKNEITKKREEALKERGIQDPSDVLFEMSQKLAERTLKTSQNLKESTQENLKEIIEKQIEKETKSSLIDTIQISKEAKPAYAKLASDLVEQQAKHAQRQDIDRKSAKQEDTFKKQQGLPTQASASQHSQSIPKPKRNSLGANQQKVTHYLQLLAQNLVAPDPKKAEEMRHSKESLLTTGVSVSKLSQLESTVSQVIHKDIKKQLKKSFTDLALSMDKKNFTIDQLKLGDVYDKIEAYAINKGTVNAEGGSLQDVKTSAKQDLQSFVSYELDNAIMETRTTGGDIQDLVREFDKYNRIAGIAHFNTGAYIRTLQKKLEDWGLNDFERPEALRGVIESDHIPALNQDGGSGSKNQQHTPNHSEESEDELRTLIIQKGVKQDIASLIELSLQIMSIKRKMKREGTHTDAQIQQIIKEGQALAKVKLMALLKESLEEKASISDIKSPAFKLAHKKYKNAIKGLKNLDSLPPKNDIIVLRDQINTTMFSIIREEYLKIKVNLESMKNNIYLMRKEKEYLELLGRLKAESNIKEPLDPTSSTTIRFSSNHNIIEAA